MEWYQKSAEDALKELNTNAEQGLSESAAEHRLERYGANALPQKNGKKLKAVLLEQCSDILTAALFVAMLCSAATKSYLAAFLFLVSIAARIVPGIMLDLRFGRKAGSLESFRSVNTKVWREGHTETVPTEEVVPGDIVILEAGDIVPADLRLIESYSLQIDESMLSGSAGTCDKKAQTVLKGTALKDEQVNMAFAGTTVVYGRGRGVVTATGENSELKNVAGLLRDAAENDSGTKTEVVGQEIGLLCIAGWLILLVADLIYGETALYLKQLSTFAAAVIPGGLVLALSVAALDSLKKFKADGVRINDLSAMENLSRVNVICTDRTGTLTENEMVATLLWTNNRFTVVEGSGYTPEGKFRSAEGEVIDPWERKDLIKLLSASALCNNAVLEESDVDIWTARGDAMEAALLAMTEKAGIRKSALESAFPRLAEIPFDAERRRMTTVHRTPRYPIAYVKGAAEEILSRCTKFDQGKTVTELTERLRQRILKINTAMSEKSLRVLAVAYRDFDALPAGKTPEDLENGLTFIGLIGILNPARSDSAEAVKKSRIAKIRTVLVTAESRNNAVSVAKTVGILREKDGEPVLTGGEWKELTEKERKEAVARVPVFAEIAPGQKTEILEALHRNGAEVAVTGAGMEDVPALYAADVGVANGKSGTEIAGTAAQVVLEDDGYASLMNAVKTSRILFANLRGIARYLLSAGTGAGIIVLFSVIFHNRIPFPTVGILLCSLILFTLPAVAIGCQGEERGTMTAVPRKTDEPLVNRTLITEICGRALIQACLCGIFYLISVKSKSAGTGANADAYAASAVYTLYVLSTLLSAFSCRWSKTPLWEVDDNRDLLPLLGTVALGAILHIVFTGVGKLRTLFDVSAISMNTFLLSVLFAVIIALLSECFKLFVLPKLSRPKRSSAVKTETKTVNAAEVRKIVFGVAEKIKKIDWKRFSPLDLIRFSDDGEENDDDEYDLKYVGKTVSGDKGNAEPKPAAVKKTEEPTAADNSEESEKAEDSEEATNTEIREDTAEPEDGEEAEELQLMEEYIEPETEESAAAEPEGQEEPEKEDDSEA